MRYALAPITLATAAAACVAQGSVVAADNFESYTAGQQLETASGTKLNGGTGFTAAYNINDGFLGGAKVASSSLSYTSGALNIQGGNLALGITGDTGVVNRFLFRPFPSQTGTLFFSFLYRTNNPASDEDFIQIGLSNAEVDEQPLTVGTGQGSGTNANPFFIRVPTTTAGNKLSTDTFLQPDTTYFIVGKIGKSVTPGNYNSLSLYLNPTTLTEPVTPLLTRSADSTLSSVSQFGIRIARLNSSEVYLLDNLQIGTTYTDVVPEPATLSFMSVGAGMLLLSRRRLQRTA